MYNRYMFVTFFFSCGDSGAVCCVLFLTVVLQSFTFLLFYWGNELLLKCINSAKEGERFRNQLLTH